MGSTGGDRGLVAQEPNGIQVTPPAPLPFRIGLLLIDGFAVTSAENTVTGAAVAAGATVAR